METVGAVMWFTWKTYWRRRDGEIRDKEFNQCLISKCTAKEIENNGEGAITRIHDNLREMLDSHKSYVERTDIAALKTFYADKGLNESNAYLHVRGHNIFDLISYIGKMLSQQYRIDFVKSVLASNLPSNDYWELDQLVDDVHRLGKTDDK